MFKTILASLSFAFFLTGVAYAVSDSGGGCAPFTTCLAASTGYDGTNTDARPATFTETNSTVVMIPVFFIPTGDTNDTGTEVAALIGVDCQDVYAVAPAGGSGDELTDGDCSTDISNGAVGIMFTK